MKHGLINIGSASPVVVLGAPEKNAKKIIEKVIEADRDNIKILSFPELSVSAYTCSDLFFSDTLIRCSEEALIEIASATSSCDVLFFVGLPFSSGGKLYNCAAAVHKGKILGIVPKSFIPNYGEFYELRHFAPAPESNSEVIIDGNAIPFGSKLIFECQNVPHLAVGCEICEDMWVSSSPAGGLAGAGATVIVNLSASNELIGKDDYRRMLVRSTSGKLICAYVFTNAGDNESTTDVVFSGHSIIAENGVIKAENPPFEEKNLIYAPVDIYHLSHDRMRINTCTAYDANGYRKITFSFDISETSIEGKIETKPFIPTDPGRRRAVCSRILDIQSRGLSKRLISAHAKTAVLGISGGLDSSLALLAAVRAMDHLKRPHSDIIAVTMPCYGTTVRTKSNAEKLCEELGVSFRCVDISEAVAIHFRDIGHAPGDHSVVYENSQARERTQVIMDIANGNEGIVVGTGDLSELALGWATYNGDHMSNYGVNSGIPKTLIRHIVSYYAEEAESKDQIKLAGILRDILDTPVSPELLPPDDGEIAQRTEDIVGPYELHDFFLYRFVRWGEEPDKMLKMAKVAFAGEYTEEVIAKWLKLFMRRFFTQQFKRSSLPDGPKVGSVALSPRGDWRMPSDMEPWDLNI